MKPGCRRDQAVEMAALIPAVASTSTSSIFNCFSGSSRMRPSVDVVTVQSAATLSVAPDGSVTVRSTRAPSADAGAATSGAAVCGAMVPGAGAAHPDSAARARSIATVLAIIGKSPASIRRSPGHLAWRKLFKFTSHVCRKPAQVSVALCPLTPWHTPCCINLGEIPEMTTSRIQATLTSKRVARVALETVLVLALLLPWVAILAWLFSRNALR